MGILVFRDQHGITEPLGRIDFERNESASFTYDGAYLQRARSKGELGVSVRLPLSNNPYSAEEIRPFFMGLLPEGEVYSQLMELYRLPRNDYLSLLENLGCESIGALTFVSEGVDRAEYAPAYDSVDPQAFAAAAPFPAQLATSVASSTRLSLAGAQSKIAWFLPEGLDAETAALSDWMTPRGTAPSTHIVKICRPGEEDIALNEKACSILAKSCGIDVAPVTVLSDVPGVIAVKRYDRVWIDAAEGRILSRLHQEDFCQALGLATMYKYQPAGTQASYLSWASDLIYDESAEPNADMVELAKRMVFNLAVGNTDAHLKNWSLLYDSDWRSRRLAPLYDVTCIPLTRYSTALPFEIGGKRALEDIDEQTILSIAIGCDVSFGDFDKAVAQVLKGFDSPSLEGTSAEERQMLERIVDNAKDRLAVIARAING